MEPFPCLHRPSPAPPSTAKREGFARPAPTREALVERVVQRTTKWLKRNAYIREDLAAHASNESKPLSSLEELAMLGMQRGRFETPRESDEARESDDNASAPKAHANVVPISASTLTQA